MSFDVSGLIAGLQRAEAQISRAAQQGLGDAGEHILDAAEIPVLTGALRDSARVDVDGDEATVSFGTDHAVEVHEYENPFLERAVVAERGRVGEIIADRVRRVT